MASWRYYEGIQANKVLVKRSSTIVPFAICAVELAAEQMVVMGQVVPGVDVDELTVGDEVELVLDTLYEDDEHEYMVWKWRPVDSTDTADEEGDPS